MRRSVLLGSASLLVVACAALAYLVDGASARSWLSTFVLLLVGSSAAVIASVATALSLGAYSAFGTRRAGIISTASATSVRVVAWPSAIYDCPLTHLGTRAIMASYILPVRLHTSFLQIQSQMLIITVHLGFAFAHAERYAHPPSETRRARPDDAPRPRARQ